MKQFLFFFALLYLIIPVQAQADIDFGFKTSEITVFTQTVDSTATEQKKKLAKPGEKVDNVIQHDTVFVNEGALRYLTKQDAKIVIYDPNNPKANTNYTVEYAGWLTKGEIPIIKYNLIGKNGVYGILTVNLFTQQYLVSTPTRQILYTNRN